MDTVTRALLEEFSTENGTADLDESKKFEHFCAYSVVSSKYSEDFDTSDLVIGDGDDLCVDAFAIKVNGRIADDPDFIDDVLAMNGYLEVEFIIIQSKTSSSFNGAEMLALGDNLVNEVFSDVRNMPANKDVMRLIAIKDRIYKNASKLKENPTLSVFYVCTGTWTDDPYLLATIERKKRDLCETNLFSEVHYIPLGARGIQKLFRDTRKSISREIRFDKLVTLPAIHEVQASYLGILPHGEFLKLITDGTGELVKSVFVDNVRDFQGDNPVNTDIARTITDKAFDQFVLRNNGITIVARNIKVTSNMFTLEDYQIVNGCQTSHVIYANHSAITDDLFIPVKLIHTESEEVGQAVIKSTNKQTPVEEDDLLALTQFQRDLEDYYRAVPEDYRLHYERRAKQYAGQAIEKGRIVSIGSQLKSFASMFIELPNQASRYQGTLLKSVNKQVFQQGHKPEPYFAAALTLYRFEVNIRRLQAPDRAIKSFRFYLLLAFRFRYEDGPFPGAADKKVGKYCKTLINYLDTPEKAKQAFDECMYIVQQSVRNLGLPMERDSAKSRPLVDEVKRLAADHREKAAALPATKSGEE